MTQRKRNEDEQRLHDQIEALKVDRRSLVTRRETALAELMALTSTHSNTSLSLAARLLLERAEAVKDIDTRIATQRSTYESLRAKNDSRN